MPYVLEIVSSDLFLEDTGDEKNQMSTNTLMTDAAYGQCNSYIADVLFSELSVTFSEKPLNAFSLGGFQYLVNADLEITPIDSAPFTRRFACRIKYLNNKDETGIADNENWDITGISGLDDI
jgi:hypothetical protein